jgi:RNA polymerase sigma-70 factor (sigma-E family)
VVARTPALLGIAYALTGDRGLAEDLLQTPLLNTYRHWGAVRTSEHPDAYVRRVMANQRISWWRRRRVLESGLPVPDRATAARDSGIEDRDELWRALRQLPPRTRAVVVLRYWEDLPEAEVADILGFRRQREEPGVPRPEPAASSARGRLCDHRPGEDRP